MLPSLALVVTLGAGSPAFASSRAGGDVDQRGADPVAQALLDARGARSDAISLETRLSQRGTADLPSIFETLSRGRFEVRVGERGNTTKPITPDEREALVRALGHLPWTDVTAFLDELRSASPDDAQRLTALAVLGTHGTAEDVPALFRWAEPQDGGARVPLPRREAFAAALGAVLGRHPDTLRRLPHLYRSAHLSLATPVLGALGERPSHDGLRTLASALGEIPEADPHVLVEISSVAAGVRHPVDEETRFEVRAYLTHRDAGTLTTAIVAARRLGDVDAVPRLIELLDHSDRNVRRQAHAALKGITGQTLAADSELWAAWHAEVIRWWNYQAPEQMDHVRDSGSALASRAIMELSNHSFFRHELVEPLSFGLLRDEEGLVAMTCAALGHLGSPLAVPPLLDSLDHPSSLEIRRAAFLALRRITGEDHGGESQDWIVAGW